jgi:ABC-type oligopeptide transport system ATPase subunit
MSLSIIHLTDIHMVGDREKNIILSRKQQLYEACYSVLSPSDNVVIVISGDIAFSGKTEEYENAFYLIDFLQQKLNEYLRNDITVLIIPGNHDCDFDGAHSLRERLLTTFDASLNVDTETLDSVTSVQKNFFEFSEYFTKYDPSELCNLCEVNFGTKKLLFQMINSAWMSQKDEQPGKLILPQNTFRNFNADNYDCVFAVIHHPYNWLHPNNSADFLHNIRQTTDVLLIGHEHRKESSTSIGEKWLISEFRGEELQNDSDTNSAFSMYLFDEGFQNLTTYDFSWKDTLYHRTSERSSMFTRNTLTSSLMLIPSKKFIDEYIDDPGMVINHENADNVRLSEVYCWPDLEQIEVQDVATIMNNKRITCDVPMQLLTSAISVIIGESLSGKTSLAKMLFKDYSQGEKCCVLLNGVDINTIVERNLRQRIEDIFASEYSVDNLERYRQLPPEKRVLIIDDFNNLPYHDERRSKVLSLLSQFASNIVIFIDNEVEGRIIKLLTSSDRIINYYRICNFGNSKRHEFIKKWYCIRNEYANGDEEIEAKIINSSERINALLGRSNRLIPATPIYLISLLQNIDSVVPASFAGSQYGFLYDSLINKSLSVIEYPNAGALNIDINIMSNLAFNMLRLRSNTFTITELIHITNAFSAQKKVSVNTEALLRKMLASRLIQELGPNTFKFRYPYAFYYFSGRHIAYNLSNPEVKEQIEYLSQRLYSERYGNIIIFVCHFANNIEIIDNILLVAYTSLENYEMFDFNKHTDIFERAKGIMDIILTKSIVGTESDVEDNRQRELKIKDELGIQDGSVCEPTDVLDEVDEREKDLASLSSAMRTLDVLGQIIMNYPGDIDGDVKISIIDEIHKLGMRITEAMLSTIGLLEREFIEYVVEYVKDKKHIKDTREVIQVSQTVFSWFVVGMTCGMIRKISTSLCNEALLIAVQETFTLSESISQKLILADLQFNILKKARHS